MKRLKVGILDLVTKSPKPSLYGRIMNPNLASIMPQALGVWCEEEGHEVSFVCFTGHEDIVEELGKVEVLFVGAFTQAAQLAYSVSALFRERGAVTILGGPHARCYPDDAVKYFDYVLGFTDRDLVHRVLAERAPNRPVGLHLSAARQPTLLPGVRERWRFIEPTLAKAPTLKGVPMIGSLGCPYTCSFCIDSEVDYQPLEFRQITEDLRFVMSKFKKPWVTWHDPNFGVRFDDTLTAIEEAVPPGKMSFVAESSLALLKEDNLKRLKRIGFKALLPGIESWYDLGNKSKTGKRRGMEKVGQVAEHVNLLLKYVPYVQTNFVLGLDVDEGDEPFELTKRFLDLTPGAFPGYSLLSAFGEAAPLNLGFQRAGRLYPFPFHFLNNNQAMNVKPKNYTWAEFYDRVIDLTRYSFSWKQIWRRMRGTQAGFATWVNPMRAVSSEGFGRIRFFSELRRRLDEDREIQAFFARDTEEVPSFYVEIMKRDLGPLWPYLPEGALHHDPYAYLKKAEGEAVEPEAVAASAARE